MDFASKSYLCIAALLLCIIVTQIPQPSQAQIQNPDRRCQSTGPTCLSVETCVGIANGMYQWCGACNVMFRCLSDVLTYYNTTNPAYPLWDDHKKNFETSSTTCQECYFECPSWAIDPPKDRVPQCDSTGPGCLPSESFCGPQPTAGNYQYCGNCTHYIYCGSISGNPHTLSACASGTLYDHSTRTCTPTSSTCRECYAPCPENLTSQGPPEETSTVEISAGGTSGVPQDEGTRTAPPGAGGASTTKASIFISLGVMLGSVWLHCDSWSNRN